MRPAFRKNRPARGYQGGLGVGATSVNPGQGASPRPGGSQGYAGSSDSRARRKYARTRSRPIDEDRLTGEVKREDMSLELMDLRRNAAIVAAIVARYVDGTIGRYGLVPQPTTSDPVWNEERLENWTNWGKICDVRGRIKMAQIQKLAVASDLLNGDMGIVLLRNGQIQPIESERILTPGDRRADDRIVNGVELDAVGRPIAYHVGARDRQGRVNRNQTTRFDAQDFVFLHDPLRFDQVRGIPRLAPAINQIADLNRLNEEILTKAIWDAFHGWAITTEDGGSLPSNMGPRDAGNPETDRTRYEYFDPMMTYYLGKGEKVESLESKSPNGTHDSHWRGILQLIGACIEVPYEYLLMMFSSSYNAGRAARLMAFSAFDNAAARLVDCGFQRVYNWQGAKEIAAGRLDPAPLDRRGYSEWWKCDWITPERIELDRGKEATADVSEFRLGMSSLTSLGRRKNRTGKSLLREKGQDLRDAIAEAKAIAAETGESVSWKDLISVSVPGEKNANETETKNDQEEKDDDAE